MIFQTVIKYHYKNNPCPTSWENSQDNLAHNGSSNILKASWNYNLSWFVILNVFNKGSEVEIITLLWGEYFDWSALPHGHITGEAWTVMALNSLFGNNEYENLSYIIISTQCLFCHC